MKLFTSPPFLLIVDRLDRAFGEPKRELAGSSGRVAAAVGEVVLNCEGEVATDGTWGRVEWVGGTHHGPDRFDCIFTLDGDGNDWSAGEVVDDAVKERSLFMLGIVLFDGCARSVEELESDNFEVSSLDAASDFADQIALDPAGLDEYKCCFHFESVVYRADAIRVCEGLVKVRQWLASL